MRSILKSLLVFVLLATAGFAEDDFAETKKKAEAGDAEAQCRLGVMYSIGEGVPKDDVEAVKWYCAAAEQGDSNGQRLLGLSYYYGDGVRKDLVQAHAWLNIAGAKGYRMAKTALLVVEKEMTSEQKTKAKQLARELFAKLPKGK